MLRTHAATLFREVLKSANSGILAVVINYRYLAESKWLLCFTDARVLFIANWKRVVTVVLISTAALFALNDGPEARLCGFKLAERVGLCSDQFQKSQQQ